MLEIRILKNFKFYIRYILMLEMGNFSLDLLRNIFGKYLLNFSLFIYRGIFLVCY